MTTLTHLECSLCGRSVEPGRLQSLCECGGPLLARYDLESTRLSWSREWLGNAPSTMWRYAPLLPLASPNSIVSLGEGMTPMVRARRLGEKLIARDLWIKDEGINPTASVKARGFSCAVSMAVERGIPRVTVASSGNAASALAAYAAAAGIQAQVVLPRDVPLSDLIACRACGAEVSFDAAAGDGHSLGAFEEPYRVEGSKTIGFEIAEQFHWNLPDAVLYPTGHGVGLIGVWKAFEELEAIGWIAGKRPKMIAVQADGCRPVVDAFLQGRDQCRVWEDVFTLAGGLRVPKPLLGHLILKILKTSGGTAVAVSDQEMLDAGLALASAEGIFAAPEGAACVAALGKLLSDGTLGPDDRIVICNTAQGNKYLEAYSTRFPRALLTEQDKLGGLITPR
jgi:threonine synthase